MKNSGEIIILCPKRKNCPVDDCQAHNVLVIEPGEKNKDVPSFIREGCAKEVKCKKIGCPDDTCEKREDSFVIEPFE